MTERWGRWRRSRGKAEGGGERDEEQGGRGNREGEEEEEHGRRRGKNPKILNSNIMRKYLCFAY